MKKKIFGRVPVAVHGNEFVAGYGVGGGGEGKISPPTASGNNFLPTGHLLQLRQMSRRAAQM